jgi:AcrR family transcriptional regulator
MSKNERSKPVKRGGKSRRKPDQRILRTRNRLGNALIALILEKPIDEVTVQQVLNRAGVGRSTFYLHFRDKDDLFLSANSRTAWKCGPLLSARISRSHVAWCQCRNSSHT